MLRAISHRHEDNTEPFGTVVLDHTERHLRRKAITTSQGDKVMVDLPEPVLFADGDRLVLENGKTIEIIAAKEKLYAVTPTSACPIRHLAWHLGNRHLAAQIDEDRILIQRDHVIRAMLEGLGAKVAEVIERFQPVHGAYHQHGGHEHAHHHDHGHHHHGHHHHD
ncbi:MAG: urease accessory protein UreE [Mesorhizobium sp.]